MDTRDTIATERLIDAAESAEDIIVSAGREGDGDGGGPGELRCAICGTPESEARGLPVGYSNPVCDDCDRLAVGESGDSPWHQYPPGEESPATEDGVIHLGPDRGENPVYIAGAKCWRRYRFGGWITRRDAFDCESVEEFHELHRVGGDWTHAFNTSRPGGLDISRDECEGLQAGLDALRDVRRAAQALREGESTLAAARNLRDRIDGLDPRFTPESAPSPEDRSPGEFGRAVLSETRPFLDPTMSPSRGGPWGRRAKLCERYFDGE